MCGWAHGWLNSARREPGGPAAQLLARLGCVHAADGEALLDKLAPRGR